MSRVIKFPRQDDVGSVLVSVISTSSRPLDLRLVGTEGFAPYISNLRHGRIGSLQAKNSPCTADEWETILESILLTRVLSDGEAELMAGVEGVASVEENVSIDIAIRKRTEGITQRLGAIHFSYDENQEIQLFEWCGTAIEFTNALARELGLLRGKQKEQQETINNLKSHLEDLITAKTVHETELLEKFCLLLNEKKSKIRDQQRLLASKGASPPNARAAKSARPVVKHRKAEGSRPGKRKAERKEEASADEDERDVGFEDMDVDFGQVSQDSDEEAAMTPEEDETVEESTDDDQKNQYRQPDELRTRRIGGDEGAGAVDSNARATKSPGKSTASAAFGELQEESNTPPFRQLPFPRKQAVKDPGPAVGDNEGSETASEDDEL